MRSDATRVCLTCKTRFSRLYRACPADALHPLFDLREPEHRREIEAAVEPRELPAPVRTLHRVVGASMLTGIHWCTDKLGFDRPHPPWWWLMTGLPVVAWAVIQDPSGAFASVARVLTVLALWPFASAGIYLGAMFLLFFAVVLIFLPIHAILGTLRAVEALVRHSLHAQEVKRYPRLTLAPPPEPRPGGEKIRGVVRAKETIPSALAGHPCVAWRVTGRAHWGDVDDTGGGDFELDAQEGPVSVSLGGEAYVDVPAEAPPRARRPEELRGFSWWPRSLLRPELSEAVIRAGDEVEVEGGCEVTSESDGYRTTRVRRAFRERDGAPLVVRRVRRS